MRHAVGDGLEPKVRQTFDGLRAFGADETLVVEFGVDKGDVEAIKVEKLRELHKRVYMALEWEWHKNCMRFVSATHFALDCRVF